MVSLENKKGQISAENELLNMLKTRINNLEVIVWAKEKEFKVVPEGHLRICDRKNYVEYYLRENPADTNGKYISKKKMPLIRKLAQKDYDAKILDMAKKELDKDREYVRFLEENRITKIYEALSGARKELVVPVWVPDELYIKEWLDDDYETMGFGEDMAEFYSENGVRLRSKSELIIATYLEKYGVPYKYERPLSLKGVGSVRPDFTCLNVGSRKEFIWEHFGMMDNIAYANKNVAKIEAYEQTGYFPGKNMIMTFETSRYAVNSNTIKSMIEQYLI